MFYSTMTHCAGRSCTIRPMRIAISLLLFPLLFGAATRAQSEGLRLEAASDRTIYSRSANMPAYVEAKILVPTPSGPDTGSVRNIALVLDRSGSMAGEPIQALRQAVSLALGTLAERDVVSIVLFGSEVETVLAAQRRDELGDLDVLLAKIEPAGGAALYDALNQGAAQLRRYAATATISHLVLVTDGPATKGPRERADFLRLAELLAREGFTLSTIGLGEEFQEDLLADLARTANGRFRFAAQPGDLPASLQSELARLRTPLARNVELSIEFGYGCEEIETAGWVPAVVEDRTITYRFPAVFVGQDVGVLAGARFSAYRDSSSLASVRLRWMDVATGESHELSRRLTVYVEADTWASRKSVNCGVIRAAVGAVISEGIQRAIAQLDKGDLTRALRELRRTRDKAQAMNYNLDDKDVAARIRILEAYLAEVRARGLNQLDRKVLRSGLNHQFEVPTAEASDE